MSEKKSGFERDISDDAESRQLNFTYEPMTIRTLIPWDYKIDFALKTKSGKMIYIEAKGNPKFFNADKRKKWRAMYEKHKKDYDIRFLFERDVLIGRKMTYSKWAEKMGVKYHIGRRIPQHWVDE